MNLNITMKQESKLNVHFKIGLDMEIYFSLNYRELTDQNFVR